MEQGTLPLAGAIPENADLVFAGSIIACSERIADLLRYDRKDLIGLSLSDLMPPAQADGQESAAHWRMREEAARAGLTQCFRWRFRASTGDNVDGLLEVELLDTGTLVARFDSITTVAQPPRRQKQLFLQQILDNAPAAVYIRDPQGRFLMANQEFCRIVGRSEAQILGASVFDIFAREYAEVFYAADQQVICTREATQFEHSVATDGLSRHYFSSKFPLFDQKGGVYGVCGITTDITARTKLETALRNVALGVSGSTGEDVFRNIVYQLARTLGADLAFVACKLRDRPVLRTQAMFGDGAFMDNTEYELVGTPCASVVDQEFRYIANDVMSLYPRDNMLQHYAFSGYAGFPLFDSGGQALGLIAIASRAPLRDRDVIRAVMEIFSVRASAELERLNADRLLHDREEQYRSVFNTSSDGLVLYNGGGQIVDANPQFRRIFAMDSAPPQSRFSITGLMLDANRDLYAGFTELLHHDRPFHLETMVRKHDGRHFFADITGQPMQYRGAPHYLTMVRDITDKKLHEEAIVRSEAMLRALFEAAYDCIIVVDNMGVIIEFNTAAETCFNIARSAALNRSMIDLVLPERYREDYRQNMIKYLTVGNCAYVGHRVEIIANRADGVEFPAELTVTATSGMDGIIFIAYLRDITDRKRSELERTKLESQLRQAQKMEAIGHLAGGFAHDFNNILTSVTGHLVLAMEQSETQNPQKLQKYLGRAVRSGDKARDLVQQMLTFARGQRGEPRPLQPGPMVREAARLLQVSLPSSIEIMFELAPGLPLVMMDAVHLEQILMNLCINARDALPGKGQLRIAARLVQCADHVCASCRQAVNGGYIEISVQDNGAGIPPEVMERMFEPFFTTKEVGKGSGMGLPMVHGIVHEYGGHIGVKSRTGQGTTVSLLLKPITSFAADGAPDHKAVRTSTRDLPPLTGRVLIVDDEEDVGEFLLDLLEGWGMNAMVYQNPGAAIDYFLQHPDKFDLVLTDFTMPKTTGIELARRIRQANPDVPVVLATGYMEALSDADLRAAGIQALLKKPIDLLDAYHAISALL